VTTVSSRKIAIGPAWAMMLSALLLPAAFAEEESKPPKDYRKLILGQQATLLGASVERGAMDISDLRPAENYQGAEWVACLMTDTARKPRKWAIYFHGETIIHVREALAIDRCTAEVYTPLKAEAKKTEAKKKPAP
jgi:hypothetical protein